MKRKWWIAGFLLVLTLLICLCFFSVRIRLFPRVMLSRGLNETFSELQTRYQDSPVHLLDGVLGPDGRQELQLQLETEHPYLGVTRYDMIVHTQLSPNRIRAEGTVIAGGKALNLEIYLDESFAALSSQGLLEGKFYGITYDSFSRDMGRWELLTLLLGDEIISGWEASVLDLKTTMSADYSTPDFSTEDIRDAVFSILALKPRVENSEWNNGEEIRKVQKICFRASGQEIIAEAAEYMDRLPEFLGNLVAQLERDPDSSVEVAFFLDQSGVLRLEAMVSISGKLTELAVEPGKDALNISVSSRVGADLTRHTVSIQTQSNRETYEERILFSVTKNGVQKNTGLQYLWDLSSRELSLGLTTEQGSASLRANLTGEDGKVSVISQDISEILSLFREKEMESPVICSMTVSSGKGVAAPEYQNLDQWSLEDLWTLLSGLGKLFGLNLDGIN